MQLVFEVQMSAAEYAARQKELPCPVIPSCPICLARITLVGHGFYPRNGLPSAAEELAFYIRRLLCPVCRKTVSLLPSFLVPYFQYTVDFIVRSVRTRLSAYRQLLQFHSRRFMRNLNLVQGFFRERGFREELPTPPKQKAIKLLELIEDSGASKFSTLFHKHHQRGFMAL